ncbi:hypothetical protein QBC43DRAFT_58175 [Cladorrhinum sp. PSN259]|nr:hypothetical protein QBC43DRAFT_58175 [Cladorrhinum sp. PSN259]
MGVDVESGVVLIPKLPSSQRETVIGTISRTWNAPGLPPPAPSTPMQPSVFGIKMGCHPFASLLQDTSTIVAADENPHIINQRFQLPLLLNCFCRPASYHAVMMKLTTPSSSSASYHQLSSASYHQLPSSRSSLARDKTESWKRHRFSSSSYRDFQLLIGSPSLPSSFQIRIWKCEKSHFPPLPCRQQSKSGKALFIQQYPFRTSQLHFPAEPVMQPL